MPPESLYGARQASKSAPKKLPASTSLSFSTNLSSLISASRPTKTASSDRGARARNKPDIFTSRPSTTSKPSKKRPHDSDEPSVQRHQTNADIGSLDSDALRLSKRRLEDKARLYASLKRGETVNPPDTARNGGLVDFDRKWAETKDTIEEDEPMSSGMSSSEDDSGGKKVEYTDSLGRTRLLSPRSHRRIVREEQTAKTYGELSAADVARPAEPEQVIYGDAIQHHAFNPDATTQRQMADLAAKRDREATPPEEKHYDASEEIRGRGTGFYAFSRDQEVRRDEMQALERERERTERVRREKGLDTVNKQEDIEKKPTEQEVVPNRDEDPAGYAEYCHRRQREFLAQKQIEHENRLEQERQQPGGIERQQQRAFLQRPGPQALGQAVSEGASGLQDPEKEARRKLIEEQRAKVRADKFLKGLEGDILGGEEAKEQIKNDE